MLRECASFYFDIYYKIISNQVRFIKGAIRECSNVSALKAERLVLEHSLLTSVRLLSLPGPDSCQVGYYESSGNIPSVLEGIKAINTRLLELKAKPINRESK